MKKKPIRVLLLEDNPADLLLFREYLHEDDLVQVELDQVDRLITGLEHLVKDQPDVILMNLGLLDSQGMETFKQIYAQAPEVPIIVLTEYNDEEQAVEAVRIGAQDYLVKGEISSGLLARAIRYAIDRKQTERAVYLMSDTIRRIAHLDNPMDIYRLVGEKIQALIGNGYVTISMLDEQIQAMKPVGNFGFGSLYDKIVQRFNMDPSKFSYYLKDMTPDELRLYRSGKLENFEGGLFHLLTRKIPKLICEIVESELELTGIYTMGFAWQNLHFGDITILAKCDIAPFKYMIESIMNQATITIKRIRSEDALRESEERSRRLVETLPDGVIVHSQGRVVFANSASAKISGVTNPTELIGKPAIEFVHPDYREMALERIQKSLIEGVSVPSMDEKFIQHDGTQIDVQVTSIPYCYAGKEAMLTVFNNTTERKQAEKLQDAIYRIAQAADQAESLDSLYPSIHAIIREIMVADNFYIALYDEMNDLLSFPYSVDDVDPPIAPKKPGKGLTEYVLRNAQSLLCDEALGEQLNQRGETELVGVHSPIWLGVPLIIEGKAIGVMAVQDYKNARTYGEREQRILEFVSSQSAMAIHRKRVELTLKTSENRFRDIADHAQDWIWEVDAEGKYVYASQVVERILGYTPEEILQKHFYENFHPDDRESDMATLASFTVKQPFLDFIHRNVHKNGQTVWLATSGHSLLDDNGNLVGYRGVSTDITNRKMVEEALRESESSLQGILRSTSDGILAVSTENKVVFSNERFAEMWRIPKGVITSKDDALLLQYVLDQLIDPDCFLQKVQELYKSTEESIDMLFFVDGRVFERLSRPLMQEVNLRGRVWSFRDITESKRNEEALRALSTRQEAILVAVPDIIMEVDNNKVYTWANQAGLAFFGDNVIGKEAAFYFAGKQDTYDTVQPLFGGAENVIYVESWQRRKDGEKRLLAWWCQVLKDQSGNVTGALSSARDITDHWRVEKALRTSEAELRALFAVMTDAVIVYDIDGRYIKIAPTNPINLYRPPNDMLGKTVHDILPKEKADYIVTKIREAIQANQVVAGEYPLQISGKEIWFASNASRLSENTAIWVAHDITERKLAEEVMRQRLAELEALHTIAQTITSSLDLQRTLNVVLEQTTVQLGMDAASVLLLNPNTLLLEFAANRGFHTAALQNTRLRLGEGYAGRAALERQPIHISDLGIRKTDFLRSPYFSAEGFTDYYVVPLIVKGEVKGVLEIFRRTPFEANKEWQAFLYNLAGQTAIAIDNFQLFDGLQRSNLSLSQAYDSTIEGWSRAMDLRDKETEGHSLRVAGLTLRLARYMGINETELVHIRRGALLHDIGKMGVPDQILLKPGPLSDEEWVLMRSHPQLAFDLLSPIAYLQLALDIPYNHHEKWDGSGYPRGLKSEQISLAARIFAVVDVFDALISDRPYRSAWSKLKALDYIGAQAAQHFDPKVVAKFLEIGV